MASLATLAEQLNPNDSDFGETFASGIAARLNSMSLFSATGRGAYSVGWLSRMPTSGGQVDTWHFGNTYATVVEGSQLALSAGLTYSVPCIVFKQGEADAAASTTKAAWKTAVEQLIDDFRSHLKWAGLVDTSSLYMIVDQQAYQQTGTTYADIALAAIELHRETSGKIICAGPTYVEEFTAVNDVHMTSNGYRNYGERLGRVIAAGVTWNPCYITGVSRSGTTITVTVHVPAPPLVDDTSEAIVTAIANSGFTYSGATITGVSITDTDVGDNTATIEITIDSSAGGTLGYADANNAVNMRVGPTAGPRGTIRDSESAVTQNDNTPLYNWLCNDRWTVA